MSAQGGGGGELRTAFSDIFVLVLPLAVASEK